jgi:hypothetical protein
MQASFHSTLCNENITPYSLIRRKYMNRRKFLSFLGIGGAGSLMQKLLANPLPRGSWYKEGFSKKLLDAQVEKKLNSLHGISDLQKSLLRLGTLKPFLEKARLTASDCQDTLDSISVESGIAAEADWHESITRSMERSKREFEADMVKLEQDIRDDKMLALLPETVKKNPNHFLRR